MSSYDDNDVAEGYTISIEGRTLDGRLPYKIVTFPGVGTAYEAQAVALRLMGEAVRSGVWINVTFECRWDS
jgi:hypothetical protein